MVLYHSETFLHNRLFEKEKRKDDENPIVIYSSQDGRVHVNVRIEDETAWLTQAAMAQLFWCGSDNIVKHLKNIYEEGELKESATTDFFSSSIWRASRVKTLGVPSDDIGAGDICGNCPAVGDCADEGRRLRRRRSATAQTKIVDCADEDRRLRRRRSACEKWKSGKIVEFGIRDWRRRLIVVSQPADVDVPRKSADDREHGRADVCENQGGNVGWLHKKSAPAFGTDALGAVKPP